MDPEEIRARKRAEWRRFYAKRKAAGYCYRCWEPAIKGRALCKRHAKIEAERSRARRAAMNDEQRQRLQQHHEAYYARRRERRRKRREAKSE